MGDMESVPHHRDPTRVLKYLETGFREGVRDLIGRGFVVEDAWGPVQMGVAGIVLQRGDLRITFDAERSLTSVKVKAGDREAWFPDVGLAWSRSAGTDGKPRRPGFYPQQWVPVMLNYIERWLEWQAHDNQNVADVCEWFPNCDPGALELIRKHRERHLEVRPRRDPLAQWEAARQAFDDEWRAWTATRSQ